MMTITDSRLMQNGGREVFSSDELILKGALETEGGVHLLTGCPSRVLDRWLETLRTNASWLNDRRSSARLAPSPITALAWLQSIRADCGRALAVIDGFEAPEWVGALRQSVHSASRGREAQQDGGGLLVVGDDRFGQVSARPSDSRTLLAHAGVCVIEPSSPQQLKDWIDAGFALGQAGGCMTACITTPWLADGGGGVWCRPNQTPAALSFTSDAVNQHDHRAPYIANRTRLFATARQRGLNRLLHRPLRDEVAPIGLIAAGSACASLSTALQEAGLRGLAPVLQLGLTWPIDVQLVREMTQLCRRLIVIEQGEPFVERQVIEAISGFGLDRETTQIYGKRFADDKQGIPGDRPINASMLIELLAPMWRNHGVLTVSTGVRLDEAIQRIKETVFDASPIPLRSPTFCAGCPHRDSGVVLQELHNDLRDSEYMLRQHRRKPVDLQIHGDVGCASLFDNQPFDALHVRRYAQGRGGWVGCDDQAPIPRKQLVFMGDGSFERIGLQTIRQAIEDGRDVAYLILDNGASAFADRPVFTELVAGRNDPRRKALNIESLITNMAPKRLRRQLRIVRINPEDRARYRKLLEEMVLADGLKIIIADKSCARTHQSRLELQRRRRIREIGYEEKQTFMRINTEVCEYCLACTSQTGCPGLKIVDTVYGPKVQTDQLTCTNDGACDRTNACPAFERITVTRRQPPAPRTQRFDLTQLPEPPKPVHADQGMWRCALAGVGGLDVDAIVSVLAHAGHEMGYCVNFHRQKGRAVHTDSDFFLLDYARSAPADSTSVAAQDDAASFSHLYGQADLLLGFDLLEAARAVDPNGDQRVASQQRTAMVVNSAMLPTMAQLLDQQPATLAGLAPMLRQCTQPSQFVILDMADWCEQLLGERRWVNWLMLGAAYQRGYLPLRLEVLESAFRRLLGTEAPDYLKAFRMGRLLIAQPQVLFGQSDEMTASVRSTLRGCSRFVASTGVFRRSRSRRWRRLMHEMFRALPGLRRDHELMRDLIFRSADCVKWGGLEYARQYCRRVVEVFRKDDPAKGFALTRSVIWNLARVMLIKDEVYVAQLLTDPQKLQRDRMRFHVDFDRGDRLTYRHRLQPEMTLFGTRLRFEWSASMRLLGVLARARFLRTIIPGWRKRERRFLRWYESLVDRLDWKQLPSADNDLRDQEYARWRTILSAPQSVNGFRELRDPKMQAVRRQVEQYLAADAEAFEPIGAPDAINDARRISLPVLNAAGA